MLSLSLWICAEFIKEKKRSGIQFPNQGKTALLQFYLTARIQWMTRFGLCLHIAAFSLVSVSRLRDYFAILFRSFR